MTERTEVRGGRSTAKPSPLIRVLAQLRWPAMAGFVPDEVARELAAGQVGRDYPLYEPGQELGFLLTPEGVTQQTGGTLHRFIDGDRKWIVTFAATFITLETSSYESHVDFIPRLVTVVRELKDHLPLQRWERFGYRYTNRFSEESDIASLRQLFDPAVLGTYALDFGDTIAHSVSETVYEGDSVSLLVKAAYLPPGASIETTIPSVPGRAWLLDLDAFATGPSSAFDDVEIAQQATVLAKKAHDFFEGVTTDEYRARFAS